MLCYRTVVVAFDVRHIDLFQAFSFSVGRDDNRSGEGGRFEDFVH